MQSEQLDVDVPSDPQSKDWSGAETELQLRDDLITTTIHDLRSPLGAIAIFCELLTIDPKSLTDTQRQNVKMIADATTKLRQILEDAAEAHATYKGTLSTRGSAVNMDETILTVLSHFQSRIGRDTTIQAFPMPENAAVVDADPERLTAVLVRIVEEAFAYACPGQTISITGQVEDKMLVVNISAEGDSSAAASRTVTESAWNLKGRLGARGGSTSQYSLIMVARLVHLMEGKFTISPLPRFECSVALPLHAPDSC